MRAMVAAIFQVTHEEEKPPSLARCGKLETLVGGQAHLTRVLVSLPRALNITTHRRSLEEARVAVGA